MNFHITDADIQALIDNELDHESEKRVRSCLKENNKAKERYETLKHQKELIKLWWSQKQSDKLN